MKIVLLQNIKGTGQIGDMKEVSDGFARNYLIPNKMAVAASASAVKLSETLKKQRQLQYEKDEKTAEEIAKKLEGFELNITETANDEGQLYGSIDAKRIKEGLHENKIDVPVEVIDLPEHIKTTGTHEVKLKLHPEVDSILKINITSENKTSA
ncbi:MAG: large subunit ribosomal protein L9 [Parcubacteria group bacterium Licking1014_17]|nr:MAG: large subunit ribosomal protein L9 [Parcubacteria group bacterium Licking1014_17]